MNQGGSPIGRPSTALSAPNTPAKSQLLKTPDSPQQLDPLLPPCIPELYLTPSRWDQIANAALEIGDGAKNGAGPSHAPMPTQQADAYEIEADDTTMPARDARPLDMLNNEGAAANYANEPPESPVSTQNAEGTPMEGNESPMSSPKSSVTPASPGHAAVPRGSAADPEHSTEDTTEPVTSRTNLNTESNAEFCDADASL